MENVLNADDCDHLATRQLENKMNPKCMIIQDWVEAQSKDKIISEIVHLFSSRNCAVIKSVQMTVMR